MRRSDREVFDKERIDEIIGECKICRIGFYDAGEIYIVPLNFGFMHKNGQRVLYFHSASAGRKVALVKAEPIVGFEMERGFHIHDAEKACAYSAAFESVIGTGRIFLVTDEEEKKAGLQTLMYNQTGKTNWTFDEKTLDAIVVFKLEVEHLSCKVHL